MQAAPNLILVGPMGAGKSSIGRRLAGRLGLSFVDLDEEIERRSGASVATIFDCEGEPGFRARERAVLADCLSQAGQVIATGGGTVLDENSRALMRERGFVVYLQVAVPAQLARLARERSRPLLDCDDREDVLRRLASQREPLYREVADLTFDTGEDTARTAATGLARLLTEHWRGAPDGNQPSRAHRA